MTRAAGQAHFDLRAAVTCDGCGATRPIDQWPGHVATCTARAIQRRDFRRAITRAVTRGDHSPPETGRVLGSPPAPIPPRERNLPMPDTPDTPRLTTRERRERRAERRREWAASRERKRDAADRAIEVAREAVPPMGQPILVGHHSERGHRRAVERLHKAHERRHEHDAMAKRHRDRAGNLQHELDRAIYDDDPDAIERLRERIADLLAQRERMKAINRAGRASLKATGKLADGWDDGLDLTEKEKGDLLNAARFDPPPFRGYPAYALANLGGQITKARKRLARLERAAAS